MTSVTGGGPLLLAIAHVSGEFVGSCLVVYFLCIRGILWCAELHIGHDEVSCSVHLLTQLGSLKRIRVV